MRIAASALTTVVVIAFAGCRADRETFEEGATFEAPPAVEQAPAMPIPPQPFPDGMAPDSPVAAVPVDSPALPADTLPATTP